MTPPPPTVPLPVRATLLCVSSLTVMSGAVVSPALPEIEAAFAGTPNVELLARLVITMPALAIAITGMPAGLLADRFGRRRMMLAGLVLYVLAGCSGLALDSLHAILAGRLLLGVAVAALMTSAGALIGDLFAPPERQTFLGTQAAFMAAGGVLFVPLGGILTTISWHAPFAVYALAAPLILAVAATLRDTPRAAAPVAAERRAIPFAPAALVVALAVITQIAFYLGPVQVPFLIKKTYGMGGPVAGAAVAAMTLAASLASLRIAWFAARLSPPAVVSLAAALLAIGYAGVWAASHIAFVFASIIIAGIGAGLVMPTLMAWMLRLAPPHLRGRATGALTAALFAGQFLSPLVVAPAIAAAGVAAAFGVTALGLIPLAATFAVAAATMRPEKESPTQP